MKTLLDTLFQRHPDVRPRGCLHLGANTGQERDVYRNAGIERVIWVEALSEVYAELVENIKGYKGHIAWCACVSNVDGAEVGFNVADNDGQSSSLLKFKTHAIEHPTVRFKEVRTLRTIRADKLLALIGMSAHITIGPGWFLHMDLQGAELMALHGMGVWLDKFDYVYTEVNVGELYEGCALIAEIDEFLASKGFEGVEVKIERQGWGDKYFRRIRNNR